MKSRNLWLLCSFLLVSQATLEADRCHAGLIVSAEDLTIVSSPVPSQTELEFYLDLTDADDGGSIDVGNFQVRFELTGPNAGTDVSIAGVSDATSILHPQARPLDIALVPDATEGFGATFNFGAPFVLADLDGLLKVVLDVSANVSGDYTLTALSGAGNTEFTDPIDFSSPIPFSVASGTLRILPASASVPEPSSIAFFGLFGIGVALRRRRR